MRQHCLYCFDDITKKQDFYAWLKKDACLCGVCQSQLLPYQKSKQILRMPIYILYVYNEFLETMIYQYKEGKDIALKSVFFHSFIQEIEHRYKGYTLVLMPSSEEKTKERGFHALRNMLEVINLPKIEPFYKSENRKQSLQSVEQRAHIDEIIHLNTSVVIPKTKLLLIDDVCTTGSTIKCAYNLLRKHKLSIEALVLCANPLFIQERDRKRTKVWPHLSRLSKRKGVDDERQSKMV